MAATAKLSQTCLFDPALYHKFGFLVYLYNNKINPTSLLSYIQYPYLPVQLHVTNMLGSPVPVSVISVFPHCSQLGLWDLSCARVPQSGTRAKTRTVDATLQGTCIDQQSKLNGCQLGRQIAHPPSSACLQKTTIRSACKRYLRTLSLDCTVFLTGFRNVSSVALHICLCPRNREINLSHLIVTCPVISAKIITKKTAIKHMPLPGMVLCPPVIPACRRLRQEDLTLEINVGYIFTSGLTLTPKGRSCFTKENK